MTETDLQGSEILEPIPERMGRTTRILATAFVLFCIAFWMFAFSPWARDIFQAPDQLEDEALMAQLEATCAAARAEIIALPAARTTETPAGRAEILIEANAVVDDMMVKIAQLETDSDADARLVRLWVADWEIYLADREAHVERLRSEGDVRFLNTIDNGVYVHERMDGFARVNDLDSCETPGDV